jgi:drug/metabolite transporter (DMT)-like permease
MRTVVSALTALCAAASFAVAALLQQLAAREIAASRSLRPRLLVDLLHKPMWVAGFGAMLVGFGLQATALALGPVALVAPIIATELAFALPLAMRVGHLRAGLKEWVATACVVAGVALFVVVSNPRAGSADPGPWMWVVLLVPAGLVISFFAAMARGPSSPRRAALLAIDAGVAFGLLSVLTKSVIHLAGHGAGVLFSHFEPYALISVGISAFIFSQSAYQAAPITCSMPVFDVVEPVVAVLIGALVLDERLVISGMSPLLEVAGALAAIAGVVGLARSPVVQILYDRSQVPSGVGPRDVGRVGQR